MYHFIEDKEFLREIKSFSSDIINRLVQLINSEDYIEVEASLVGSGARNLITQNGNEPIDLDYNIRIKKCDDINDCRQIKEYITDCFNFILSSSKLRNCSDSTSALTTHKINLDGFKTKFSLDVAIIFTDVHGYWYRLIHKKTGYIANDCWIWNKGLMSLDLYEKVYSIKKISRWEEVRFTYLDKKNMYLRRRDYNHPSFICYIETINEIYNKYF